MSPPRTRELMDAGLRSQIDPADVEEVSTALAELTDRLRSRPSPALSASSWASTAGSARWSWTRSSARPRRPRWAREALDAGKRPPRFE